MNVNIWALIAAGIVVTLGPKAIGPLLLAGRTMPGALQRALALLPPALVAALVVAALWGTEGNGAVARTVGVGVGTALFLRFGSLLPAMVVAAAVAALIRAVA